MSQWWYEVSGKANGPVEEVEFMRLLRVGSINIKTMVWQEGMATWLPVEDVEVLQKFKVAMPPPIRSCQTTSQLPPPLDDTASPAPISKISFSKYVIAGRWLRFFARIFDLWWETLIISLVWVLATSLTPLIPIPGNKFVVSIICIPFAMVLDAVIYYMFGNTPGKALLGIKVFTDIGNNLSFNGYLKRNIHVWASGFACGLPIIVLAAYAYQSSRLNRGERASYDVKAGINVINAESNYLLKIIFIAFFAILILMTGILDVVSKNNKSRYVRQVVPHLDRPVSAPTLTISPTLPTNPKLVSIQNQTNKGIQRTIQAYQAYVDKGRDLTKVLHKFNAGARKAIPDNQSTQNNYILDRLKEAYPGSTYDGLSGKISLGNNIFANFNNMFNVDTITELGAINGTYFLHKDEILLEDGLNSVTVVVDRSNQSRSKFANAKILSIKDKANNILNIPGHKRITAETDETSILNDAYQLISSVNDVRMDYFAADVMRTPKLQQKVLAIAKNGYFERHNNEYK